MAIISMSVCHTTPTYSNASTFLEHRPWQNSSKYNRPNPHLEGVIFSSRVHKFAWRGGV